MVEKISLKNLGGIKMARRRHEKDKNVREVPEERASRPRNNTQADIDACKARVAEGAKCFCKDECHCRRCQEFKKNKGGTLCDLPMLLSEGGCELGCNKCQNCQPCW